MQGHIERQGEREVEIHSERHIQIYKRDKDKRHKERGTERDIQKDRCRNRERET